MMPKYRIEGQYFDEKYEMGILVQLKELKTGDLLYKTPLELFNDLALLKQLSAEDVRLIGYIVGDHQMYLSQKLIHANSGWTKRSKRDSLM